MTFCLFLNIPNIVPGTSAWKEGGGGSPEYKSDCAGGNRDCINDGENSRDESVMEEAKLFRAPPRRLKGTADAAVAAVPPPPFRRRPTSFYFPN